MSFSADIKQEIVTKLPSSACCRQAMLYGMLECSRGFSLREMSLQTELPAVADAYSSLLWKCCRVPTLREEGGFSIVTVADEWRPRVLRHFGHGQNDLTLRLNRGMFDCDACQNAYLRGVFLACGAVSDPETDYHLELNVPSPALCRALETLLGELDLPPKTLTRKGACVLYYKDSEQIEDFLTRIGAASASLQMMHVKMMKDIRNNVNRANNCEAANLDKTISAAAEQCRAVRVIEENGGLQALSDELRTLAELRRDNPDLSLRELGAMLEPPLSRAGVCHRFRRIREVADGILAEKSKK